MKTRLQKYFRAGWSAKLAGIEGVYGTLYQDSYGSWYILSNNRKMNGSEPSDWDKVRGGNSYSYWICDKYMEEAIYEIDLDYAFDDSVIDAKKDGPAKSPFSPQAGDILHILSKEDVKKYNSRDELAACGSYFGHTLQVTSLSGKDAVYGQIFNKSGDLLISSWGVYLNDFYEYHGIYKSSGIRESYVPGPSLSFRTMDSYASRESITQEQIRCTLPHTADWQIAGDSVPRKKSTDMLLILGL
jgi:hypothetical protein